MSPACIKVFSKAMELIVWSLRSKEALRVMASFEQGTDYTGLVGNAGLVMQMPPTIKVRPTIRVQVVLSVCAQLDASLGQTNHFHKIVTSNHGTAES